MSGMSFLSNDARLTFIMWYSGPMDWRKYCIIDTSDDRDITEDVVSIFRDKDISRYRITFAKTNKEFPYGFGRIFYSSEPSPLESSNKLVFIRGKLQPEIKELIRFDEWCKVLYSNGKKRHVRFSDIQFISDKRGEKKVSEIMDYLAEVASADDGGVNQVEDSPGFLVNQLRKMIIREDSVLSLLIDKEKLTLNRENSMIIAPFSSNSAQLKAIRNALSSRISVIQGPPGTGKTQTILNIISNLLADGKTIAVVSGNNEATRNVCEKLVKENLGSLCASLGNKANVERFFADQPTKDYFRSLDACKDKAELNAKVQHLGSCVKGIYGSITRKAEIRSMIQELRIEKEVNESQCNWASAVIPNQLLMEMSSEDYLRTAAVIETLYSSSKGKFRRKLEMYFHFRFWPRKSFSSSAVIDYLQSQYYSARISELHSEILNLELQYPEAKNSSILKEFAEKSREYLLSILIDKYSGIEDRQFSDGNYRNDGDFLSYYPIVLSTTHSLQYCAPKDVLFDYVIIDESSQVNLTSAFLALSCAKNAVIVGDPKQLSHIVPGNLSEPLDCIRSKYELPKFIDYRKYSILECILMAFKDNVPSVFLNEHYRCDPEIIGFCNKRFYDSKLIIQTKHEADCGIRIIETPSHTAFGRTNPRQAEIISAEILPFETSEDVGIVAPYRDQVALIRNTINRNEILVDTVHKFQGKERSIMILSTTADRTALYEDPEHTDFLNNANLINVAVSRAKKELVVIASSEALTQEGTLLCDLAKYVSYYSDSASRVRTGTFSVFDLMYDEYSPILARMRSNMLNVSQFDSENIIATLIDEICRSEKYGMLAFKFNYPLRKIIDPESVSDRDDRNFILAPGTHCDFVIFSLLDKKIQLLVEVDGKQHEAKIQKERDNRKDRLVKGAGLKLLRIRTTDVVNVRESICNLLR